MALEAGQGIDGNDHQEGDHASDGQKWRVPIEMRDQEKRQGHTRHRGHRERCHDHTHGPTASVKRNNFGHNGLGDGHQNAAKKTGGDAGHDQPPIRGRQATGQGRCAKQRVQGQHHALAAKAIDVSGGQQARKTGREGVGRHQKSKLPCRNVEELGQLWAQRHHDHEIKHAGKLDAGQSEQQPAFALGRQMSSHKWFS